MKHSRRVVLTMMGSAAVGAVSMGWRATRLRPGHAADPGANRTATCGDCRPKSMAASAARRIASTAAMATAVMGMAAVERPCSASPAPSATTGARPPRAPDSIFTPSTANAIGTSAPITPSRWTRSNARSRRRPPRSTRCASNSSAARSTTKEYLRRLKIPEAFWPLISESWHRDEGSLYGRLDLCLSTAAGRQSCWNTMRIRRPRSSRPRCFSGPGSNRRSSAASSRREPTSSTRSTSG